MMAYPYEYGIPMLSKLPSMACTPCRFFGLRQSGAWSGRSEGEGGENGVVSVSLVRGVHNDVRINDVRQQDETRRSVFLGTYGNLRKNPQKNTQEEAREGTTRQKEKNDGEGLFGAGEGSAAYQRRSAVSAPLRVYES